jgi:hypothetical protein
VVGVSLLEIWQSRFITDLRESFFNVIAHELVVTTGDVVPGWMV